MTSIFYLHLAWVYLRVRDYDKASVALRRVHSQAERVGWVRGQAIVPLAQAMISRFKSEDCPLIETRVKRGRSLNKLAPRRPLDSRLEQLEFIHLVLTQDFEKAKDVALMRLSWTQSCSIYTSYSILDCLFLAKISPQTLVVRPSLIEKAQRVFRDNNLQSSQSTLNFLLNTPSITTDDFIKHYIF